MDGKLMVRKQNYRDIKVGVVDKTQEIALDIIQKIVKDWINEQKHGYVQINIKGGVITNVNCHETLIL